MPVRRTAGSASSMSLQPGTHAPGRGPLPEQRQDTHPPSPARAGAGPRLPRDPPLREVSCRGSPRRAVKRAVPVDCTGSGVAVSSRADGLTSCSSPAQRTGVRAGNTLGTQHPPASPLPRQVTPLRPGDPMAHKDAASPLPHEPLGKAGHAVVRIEGLANKEARLPSRFLPPTSFPPPLLCQPLAGLRLGSRSQPACPSPI